MSTMFKYPPVAFVRQDGLTFPETGITNGARATKVKECRSSAARNTSSASLRSDHVVLLAIDTVLALDAFLKKWRQRRKTLRALADLDERQLRDIGLTRDETRTVDTFGVRHRDRYRALVDGDDTRQVN